MAISSNTLFHFTKDLDTIKNILSDGLFWPIYCIEYDKGPNVDGTFNAFPMVCFCDIPLSQISEHLSDYGKYGIGINKQWGKEKISPITYYNHKDAIMRSLYDRISPTIKEKDRILWLSLLKRYYGKTWSSSRRKYYNKVLYNEQEWRYIPRNIKVSDLCKRVKELDDFKAKDESAHLKKEGLCFTPDVIKYIFVESKEDLSELNNFINEHPTWNTNEKSYLSSRILTIKQIKEDF